MADTFGAAPYTPERQSTWGPLTAWLRGPAPHIATGSYGDAPVRACGARHPGRCPRERGPRLLTADAMLRSWDEEDAARARYEARLKVEA